jgi:putative membrane protein
MHVLLRLLVNAAALWVATRLVSGITYTGDGVSLFGVALVFGVLNVLIRPILFFLSFPFVIFTLGLFTLVINAVMLLITGAASDALGLGFSVSGFVPALKGALVVTVVSFALSLLVSNGDKPKDKRLKANG